MTIYYFSVFLNFFVGFLFVLFFIPVFKTFKRRVLFYHSSFFKHHGNIFGYYEL